MTYTKGHTMLRKTILAAGLAVAFAAPTAIAAPPPDKAERKAERQAAKAERQAARAERKEARTNAARECRAEREEMGVEAFREQYGTNANKRNAFGKCVSGKVKQELEEDA